jgi:hypothetical protein
VGPCGNFKEHDGRLVPFYATQHSDARVAELVDARDSGSRGLLGRGGSSPLSGTLKTPLERLKTAIRAEFCVQALPLDFAVKCRI